MTSSTLVFLRAVNLPGRPFPSADIRRVAAAAGFGDPRTHAASGNLLVTDAGNSKVRRLAIHVPGIGETISLAVSAPCFSGRRAWNSAMSGVKTRTRWRAAR